jgi:multiple sugar transport system substrate-binding protein
VLTRREFLGRSARLAPVAASFPWLLAACGGDERTAQDKTSGKAQILVGFGTGNAPEQIPIQERLADAFARAGAGGSVDFLRIPDTDEAQRKLGVLIAAGDPPNMVLPTGLYGIALYVDQDVWFDLSGYMRDDDIDPGLFEEATLRAARVPNYYGADSDAMVGIPAGMFTHVVAYNKELFEKAGVPEPPHEWGTDEWTYDRQLEVATSLTLDSKGRTPNDAGFDAADIVQFGLGHWDTGMMIRGFGGSPYDPESRTLAFDTPEYQAGLQFGADLINRHHVLANDELAAGVAAGADDPQLAAWTSGKLAMIDMCACDLLSYGSGAKFAWDVAAWPGGPERTVAHLNLDVGSIVAASDNHDLSWEVLKFMLTEPDNARTLSVQGYGAMSPLKSESGKFVDELQDRFPGVDLQVFVDALPFSTPEQEEWYPAFLEVNDMSGQFLDAVYQGQAPAAERLPDYQEAAQQAVDKWFETHELPQD